MSSDLEKELARRRQLAVRGWRELGVGAFFAALAIAWIAYAGVGMYSLIGTAMFSFIAFCVILMGVVHLLRYQSAATTKPGQKPIHAGEHLELGFGFKSYVAWRYLMARDHRVSRIAIFAILGLVFIGLMAYLAEQALPWIATKFHPETTLSIAWAIIITKVAAIVLVFLTLVIGGLRYVFSFFTTVPLVGVWIGTWALVCVLAVMSGFETDLRQKILGSNAHIQVTAEDGEISNWLEVKNRIDKMPGVIASTPYAVSEVVIAANNNGMNVIIKGIDPTSVGKVTKLISSLKDKDAINRLEPLVDETHDLVVPQPGGQGAGPSGGAGSAVVDPPPDDMPERGEPIDFSQPAERGSDTTDADPMDDLPPPLDDSATGGFGGDAQRVLTDDGSTVAADKLGSAIAPNKADSDAAGSGSGSSITTSGVGEGAAAEPPSSGTAVVDPPPGDILTTDEEPIDYSGSDVDLPIQVVDVPTEPLLSRRTQLLPGILVGRELVKQTHLYVGEEVRVVSPLSDPSNPDATGTPIPFNRDYRIAGEFYTGMYEYDLKYVYVTLDSLNDFLDRGDTVDGIEVRIGSPDDTDQYVTRLQTMLGPKYRVQDWKELNRSLFSALKLEKIAMFLVLGIVILVASFSIVGNLIMVVVEKAREIALLKTLGASDMTVMSIFAIQGLLIGVVGTALGIATGLVSCYLGKTYGIPLNPDVYYIDRLPVHVDPSSVLITAAAGVLISMAATFYPALVAARVRPAAGMRH